MQKQAKAGFNGLFNNLLKTWAALKHKSKAKWTQKGQKISVTRGLLNLQVSFKITKLFKVHKK